MASGPFGIMSLTVQNHTLQNRQIHQSPNLVAVVWQKPCRRFPGRGALKPAP